MIRQEKIAYTYTFNDDLNIADLESIAFVFQSLKQLGFLMFSNYVVMYDLKKDVSEKTEEANVELKKIIPAISS